MLRSNGKNEELGISRFYATKTPRKWECWWEETKHSRFVPTILVNSLVLSLFSFNVPFVFKCVSQNCSLGLKQTSHLVHCKPFALFVSAFLFWVTAFFVLGHCSLQFVVTWRVMRVCLCLFVLFHNGLGGTNLISPFRNEVKGESHKRQEFHIFLSCGFCRWGI